MIANEIKRVMREEQTWRNITEGALDFALNMKA